MSYSLCRNYAYSPDKARLIKVAEQCDARLCVVGQWLHCGDLEARLCIPRWLPGRPTPCRDPISHGRLTCLRGTPPAVGGGLGMLSKATGVDRRSPACDRG